MEEPKIAEELQKMQCEPLLPVERKLVAWSIMLGLVLIVVLVMISRLLFGG
jgi:hypothetical protein